MLLIGFGTNERYLRRDSPLLELKLLAYCVWRKTERCYFLN